MSFDPKLLGYLSALERAQWFHAGGTGWWMPSYAYDPRTGSLLFRQGDRYAMTTGGSALQEAAAKFAASLNGWTGGFGGGSATDKAPPAGYLVDKAYQWLKSNPLPMLPSAIGTGGVGEVKYGATPAPGTGTTPATGIGSTGLLLAGAVALFLLGRK